MKYAPAAVNVSIIIDTATDDVNVYDNKRTSKIAVHCSLVSIIIILSMFISVSLRIVLM